MLGSVDGSVVVDCRTTIAGASCGGPTVDGGIVVEDGDADVELVSCGGEMLDHGFVVEVVGEGVEDVVVGAVCVVVDERTLLVVDGYVPLVVVVQ